MFLLGCLLSGLANAGEDPFMQSFTSPECHIYKRGGSHKSGLLHVQIFRSLPCNVATLRSNVATFQRHNVSTSRRQFYPSLERRGVDTQRRDVDFECLWNVATWNSNVATLIFKPSGTSRREISTSRRRFSAVSGTSRR